MSKLTASIVGGSGYAGGELIRLLLQHPHVELKQVTSERQAGKFIFKAHPNLRKRCDIKFTTIDELENVDVLFLGLPHGQAMKRIGEFTGKAAKIIDLSADFRLRNPDDYIKWYGHPHSDPDMLEQFVYGICELHREEMKTARYVSGAGCNATTTILGLFPLYRAGVVDLQRTVTEVKVGSSEAGNAATAGSHHPERSGAVRSFMPSGHRHVAEMLQELAFGKSVNIHFSATSIEMVRGVLATSHVFLKDDLQEKDIWKIYRKAYADEPFLRIVKDRDGLYRYPEPKILAGSNYCDVGFQKDPDSNRLIVISALDNLMKGAAGQAVQALNIMHGFEETTALEFPGLHPV